MMTSWIVEGMFNSFSSVCKSIPGTVLLKCIESPKGLDELLYEKWVPFSLLNNQFP